MLQKCSYAKPRVLKSKGRPGYQGINSITVGDGLGFFPDSTRSVKTFFSLENYLPLVYTVFQLY